MSFSRSEIKSRVIGYTSFAHLASCLSFNGMNSSPTARSTVGMGEEEALSSAMYPEYVGQEEEGGGGGGL